MIAYENHLKKEILRIFPWIQCSQWLKNKYFCFRISNSELPNKRACVKEELIDSNILQSVLIYGAQKGASVIF